MSASEGEDHQNRAGDARTASYPHHLYALGGVLRAGTTQGSSQRKKVGSIPDAPEAPGILVSLVPPLTSCSPLPLPFSPPTCSAQIRTQPSPVYSDPVLAGGCPWHPIVLFTSSTHTHGHRSPSLTSSFQSILIQAAWGGGRSGPLWALSPLSALMNSAAQRCP